MNNGAYKTQNKAKQIDNSYVSIKVLYVIKQQTFIIILSANAFKNNTTESANRITLRLFCLFVLFEC